MKEEMSDDQIQDFFDNLDPNDFARETSAIDETQLPQKQAGAAAFVLFVDANIKGVMDDFNEQTPQVPWQAVAVLQSSDVRRIFTPDDDETNSMFMSRLHREAQQLGAQWFFLAMVGPVVFATAADIDNAQEVDAIMWYAEAHEPSFQHIRQGMISIDGIKCGINYEGDREGAADLFKQVLRREAVS